MPWTFLRCSCPRFSYEHQHAERYCINVERIADLPEEREICEHPDPWMDSEPGAVVFPIEWAR
jgi:hypothetical protein